MRLASMTANAPISSKDTGLPHFAKNLKVAPDGVGREHHPNLLILQGLHAPELLELIMTFKFPTHQPPAAPLANRSDADIGLHFRG